ncbi:MAG: type IV secretion system DNA-binding domain-containing protein [Candidatus Hydrogenedentota bacterium]
MSTGLLTVRPQPSVSLTLPEQLTQQFYRWEQRGRGWRLWDQLVPLEPPFRPFHFYPPNVRGIDDGKSETFLSRLVRDLFGFTNRETPLPPEIPEPETWTELAEEQLPLVELQATLPPDLDVSKTIAEHLVLNLSYCQGPISFEIVGTDDAIVVQYVCQEPDRQHLTQQLKAHFPDAMVSEARDYLDRHWQARLDSESVVVDFGLSHEFVRPIETFRNFDIDPLIGVGGTLDHLESDEIGILQVMFQPCRHRWAESILHSVTDWDGGSFFIDAPEMVSLAREKISFPLYAVTVRVAASSPRPRRAWDIARGLGSALTQYSSPASNELIPLTNDGYPDDFHEHDLLLRQTHRSGMILNSDELVGLAHLPSAAVRSERLSRKVMRTKAAPAIASSGEVVLGYNTHNGRTMEVRLNSDQRVKHTYVVGASGTGKSTFLLNLITQDIQAGRGVGVLDPHGDLIDDVLARIPEHRHEDVVLFDPADEGYPIGFNVLSAHSELEKNLIASDMVAVFQRLSTSWGDQMTTVLSNAVLAFLESDRNGTLADLRRFLVEKDFRRDFLRSVKDRDVVYYWEKEFPLLSGRPQGPILTRLDAFLRPKLVRYMMAQKENRLDFADIMNGGKIFLARLAQGAIGEENAHLLGTLLVSKFHQLTLARQELQESTRRPFYLYIDEFHNFVTPSMASILTGVRKYRLGLVLAHQELRQLEKRDSEVASAALSNPYTRVCFRVGESDARKLTEGFSYFDPYDLLNLGTGEAICRVERANQDFTLNVSMPNSIEYEVATARRERIIELSRNRYATPKEEVESFLDQQWQKQPTGTPERVDEKPKAALPDSQRAAEPEPVSAVAPEPNQRTEPVSSAREKSVKPKATGTRVACREPALMGKGGQEHTYLQNLIKRWAEGMGYRATIEKPLGDGASADVALEKGDVSIACEIAVTTTPSHEVSNVKKCLVAGFNYVVAVSTDAKKLHEIRMRTITGLSSDERDRVRLFSPEALFRFIEEIEADAASREHTVKGYKVKVKYGTPGEQEKQSRTRAVSQVILGALSKRRRKG